MQLTKIQKIIIICVIVLIFIGIYFAFGRKKAEAPVSINSNQIASTTYTVINTTEGKVTIKNTGGYKIEQVPLNEGKVSEPVPDLNRPLTLYTGAIVAPEAKAYAETKVKSIQQKLKIDPKDINLWTDLGISQKGGGDYDGALISWKYAIKLAPTDYVLDANIGNLYAYFIKNNSMAEEYYKSALSKGPTQSYIYTQLAEIYLYIIKDADKARAVIDTGLSKIPNDQSLLQLKNSLN